MTTLLPGAAATALLLGAPAAPGSPPTPEADTVRVLVYNVHAGKDAEGRPNLARVAEVIRDAGADVVLLQEVDRGTERSGGVDQLARLAEATGMRGAFGRTLDFQGGEYGIGLLSRWPIRGDTLIPLPVEPVQVRAEGSHEPRGALRALIEAPDDTLRVVDTHLDAGPDDRYRRQEVEGVLEAAGVRAPGADAGVRGPPILVGGDFNDLPGSRVTARILDVGLVDAWRACGRGDGRTYPAEDPVRRIDYLFLSGGLGCASARVLATEASDHRPLLVEVVVDP